VLRQRLPPNRNNDFWVDHATLLVTSYQHLTGQPLIDPTLPPVVTAATLFRAPFVVVSHDTAIDPVFNYGNRTALQLFEMTWAEFTHLPSRYSAEPLNREERSRLLKTVSEQGFIDNYQGVRISKTGRRFYIRQATVWNVVDEHGQNHGQAATFREWHWL
jgi:hypothetical protein